MLNKTQDVCNVESLCGGESGKSSVGKKNVTTDDELKDFFNEKVSIIIPVYKVQAKYLKICIDSTLCQTYKNIEVIIVDDGAPVELCHLMDGYRQKDRRVHVIHVKNGGVSAARNIGINVSTGQYLCFLDCDDWIEQKCIELAVHWILTSKSDLVGWNHYYNGKQEKKRHPIENSPVVYLNDKIQELLLDMITPEYDVRYNGKHLGAVRGVWGKLYLSKIIKANKICFFDELKIGEDACFNIEYIKCINKAVFYNAYLSHYRIVSSSENRRYREDIVEIRLRLLRIYKELFKNLEINSFETCYTREVLSCVINCFNKYFSMRGTNHEVKLFLQSEYISCTRLMKIDKSFFTLPEKVLLYMITKEKGSLLWILLKFIGFFRKDM